MARLITLCALKQKSQKSRPFATRDCDSCNNWDHICYRISNELAVIRGRIRYNFRIIWYGAHLDSRPRDCKRACCIIVTNSFGNWFHKSTTFIRINTAHNWRTWWRKEDQPHDLKMHKKVPLQADAALIIGEGWNMFRPSLIDYSIPPRLRV